MEITNKTIVLMIDFDNFNSDEHLNILFDELEQMGNVIYKGAFYSNTDDKNIYEKRKKYGFNDFIVETTYSSRKNAVDIRIALDVMEWLRKDYVDCFCLATNDLDFAPIVRRIKQKNKTVIGAGNLEKPQEYKKLYHRFISVDKILNAKKINEKKPQENKKESSAKNNVNKTIVEGKKELIKVVNSIIKENDKNNDGFTQFSIIIENLLRKIPDFNPKNYGAQNNKSSLFFKNNFKDSYDFKQKGGTLYIKLKQKKK